MADGLAYLSVVFTGLAALGALAQALGALGYQPLRDWKVWKVGTHWVSIALPAALGVAGLAGTGWHPSLGIAAGTCVALALTGLWRRCSPGNGRRAPDKAQQSKKLVSFLHRRWFPKQGTIHVDGDYRVSLFVPYLAKDGSVTWRCAARSHSIPCGAEWPSIQVATELSTAGVVAATVYDRLPMSVPGVRLHQRAVAAEVDRYNLQTCLSNEQRKARSWPWASLQTYIGVDAEGQISAVFVVERESGEPIEAFGLPGTDATTVRLSEELQLAAGIVGLMGEVLCPFCTLVALRQDAARTSCTSAG